jgi:hypothetical protein
MSNAAGELLGGAASDGPSPSRLSGVQQQALGA